VFPATLFDFNGVLVDDEEVHFAALRDTVAPLGVDLTRARYWESYLGFDDRGALCAMLTDAGHAPAQDEIARLAEIKSSLYLERVRANLRTFPGAADLVRRRAAVGPVLIVSGALRHEVELGLEILGIRAEVRGIIASEDASECKPSPQGYLIGMRDLGALGARALVIEDSMAGVQAAKAAGLPCAAVAHTYPEPRLIAVGADLVVPHLPDLTDAALDALYHRMHG
jgi:HAD superfamily hydrolase (TIGR01509 family)